MASARQCHVDSAFYAVHLRVPHENLSLYMENNQSVWKTILSLDGAIGRSFDSLMCCDAHFR